MNPSGRTKVCATGWRLFGLAIWLAAFPTHADRAPDSPDHRQQFLQMYARAYYPGRSGQIMLVFREGAFATRDDPAYRFMHGSPWDYDARIPLLLYGPAQVRRGAYSEVAHQQDIAPTLAALLKLPLPSTVTGRALRQALDPSAGRPAVILLAVLDAMRQDYFDRHRAILPTLSRLRQEGAWFSNARVNFLPSVTAVAHATIGTGTDPRVHGIVVNSAFDRVSGKPQNPFPGKSPRNLMALSLADLWNIETDGQAVVISQGSVFYAAAGLAGHGACLLGGRRTILASYDDATGGWLTNPDCYRLPEYLQRRNARQLWEAADGRWMGHDIANPDAVSRSALFSRFEADALAAMIEYEPVGADDVTDLLLVNLKAPDFVGHQYGPDSPELRETLIELDRQVARILEALEKKVGPRRYVAVFTADHGMPPEPGSPTERRFSKKIVELVHEKFDPDRAALVSNYESSNSQLFIDEHRLRELGLKLSEIREYLEAQPFIYAAYTEDEVRNAASVP
jgi:predicted AlkP superfamily pyrophosphatase or phosphodiesterase